MADVTVDGVRLHVQVVGAGVPPVLFLHGLVMDNLSSWYFTAGTRVARHAQAVLLDLRGHGRSERPDADYGVERMVADAVGVLDALCIDRAVVVGNSFGGQLAAALAVAHPERVAGLGLVDAHLGRAGWAEDMVATLSLTGEARDRTIAASFKDWLGRHSERKRNRLAQAAEALVYRTTLLGDLRASPPLDEGALAALTVPVLALYGSESDLVSEAARLRGLVPHADVRVFDGATHSLMWERTEEVVGAIDGWVQILGDAWRAS